MAGRGVFGQALGSQLPKNLNYFSDLGSQIVYDEWGFRPPVAGRSGDVTYCYYDGGLMVILHIGLRGVDGEPRKFCATFQPLFSEIYNGSSTARRQAEIKLPLPDLRYDYVEQPVLVKIIEIAEQSQQGREGWVPSVVRLHSLDFCPHAETQRLHSKCLVGEFGGRVGDRKLQNFLVTGGGPFGFTNGSGVDEVIQSGAQIVNTVAEDDRPPIQRRGCFDIFDETAVAGTVSIDLLADDVRVAVNPSFQFAVESIGVLFRSPKFQPTACELRPEHVLFLQT